MERNWREAEIEGKRVVLVEGQRLAELMIEHDVGVTTKMVYRVKEVSGDFFEEGLDQYPVADSTRQKASGTESVGQGVLARAGSWSMAGTDC